MLLIKVTMTARMMITGPPVIFFLFIFPHVQLRSEEIFLLCPVVLPLVTLRPSPEPRVRARSPEPRAQHPPLRPGSSLTMVKLDRRPFLARLLIVCLLWHPQSAIRNSQIHGRPGAGRPPDQIWRAPKVRISVNVFAKRVENGFLVKTANGNSTSHLCIATMLLFSQM